MKSSLHVTRSLGCRAYAHDAYLAIEPRQAIYSCHYSPRQQRNVYARKEDLIHVANEGWIGCRPTCPRRPYFGRKWDGEAALPNFLCSRKADVGDGRVGVATRKSASMCRLWAPADPKQPVANDRFG